MNTGLQPIAAEVCRGGLPAAVLAVAAGAVALDSRVETLVAGGRAPLAGELATILTTFRCARAIAKQRQLAELRVARNNERGVGSSGLVDVLDETRCFRNRSHGTAAVRSKESMRIRSRHYIHQNHVRLRALTFGVNLRLALHSKDSKDSRFRNTRKMRSFCRSGGYCIGGLPRVPLIYIGTSIEFESWLGRGSMKRTRGS